MSFIPEWTLILLTNRFEVERGNGIRRVRVGRGGHGRIASGHGRRQPGRRIELRQAIEGLPRAHSSLQPVLLHRAKVMIERTILLREKNNVIQALKRAAQAE